MSTVALIDSALRNLTRHSASDLRGMKPEILRKLATDNGIAADGPPVAVLARIMDARLSESRKLGHISRANVKASANAELAAYEASKSAPVAPIAAPVAPIAAPVAPIAAPVAPIAAPVASGLDFADDIGVKAGDKPSKRGK